MVSFTEGGCQIFCIILLIVSSIIAIVFGISYYTRNSVSTETCLNYTIGEEYRNGDDYIGLYFASCPTDTQFEIFMDAAATWSAIITENRISSVEMGAFNLEAQDTCNFLENNFEFGSFLEIDHLVIIVDIVTIDSTGGVLGSTGVCATDDNGDFPLISGILLDESDIFRYENNDKLDRLVLHEMAHALGFGLRWEDEGLLEDAIFDGSTVANADNVPKFVGEHALEEFNKLLNEGQEDSEYVPVEDGRVDGEFVYFSPDTDSSSGYGSIDYHWKRETFGDELMIYAMSATSSKTYPLSAVTIGSIEDLGYAVDYSLAEELVLEDSTAFRTGNARTEAIEGEDDEGWTDIIQTHPIPLSQLLEILKSK